MTFRAHLRSIVCEKCRAALVSNQQPTGWVHASAGGVGVNLYVGNQEPAAEVAGVVQRWELCADCTPIVASALRTYVGLQR